MQQTDTQLNGNAFFCIDPPYFNKGAALYTNSYDPADHEAVANAIQALESPWILTYDNVAQIRELYTEQEQHCFYLNYSAARKRVASELLISSDNIALSSELPLIKVA
jgi:DNA adenine methylase